MSSQFDADRLDYLRRDRLMTGVEFAHLDIEWIFDCLEVGTVTLGDVNDPVEEPCLFLNPKGVQVAEEYLEARFRLYMMVYMHKTTRSAEKMLERLLERLREVAADDAGLRDRSRLAGFIATDSPMLDDYLALDDTVVWAELHTLSQSSDPIIQTLAKRLTNRELYKCFDLGAVVGERDEGNRRHRFMRSVRQKQAEGRFPDLLVDDTQVTGYKWYDFESTNALEKVLVKRDQHDPEPRDIAEFSTVVKSLIERAKIYRLYLPDEAEVDQIEQLYRETAR
jgi:HD superfamily phosphohydrolase